MKQRNYRTSEQRIQDLEAKIAAIRARDERRAARANPAMRQAIVAARAVAKAITLADDPELRARLERVNEAMCDVAQVLPRTKASVRRPRTRRTDATK